MYGGLGHWKFYIAEVSRIESEHSSKLPPSSYSNAEAQAGFDKLAKDFGSYATLVFMEEKTGRPDKELLTWSVNEFNYRLSYYAWQGHVQKKYNDIINKPRKGKK
jgi:hypothetical protein